MQSQKDLTFSVPPDNARRPVNQTIERPSETHLTLGIKSRQHGVRSTLNATTSSAPNLRLLPSTREFAGGLLSFSSSGGSRSSPASDPPLVYLVRVGLTPSIAGAFVLFLSLWDPNRIPGSYELLAAFTFCLTALVFNELDLYRGSVRFPLLVAVFDILWRWVIVIGTLVILGYTTNSFSYFSLPIRFTFAAVTPLILLGSHMLARCALRYHISSKKSPRTAVVVGANALS
jgi:hypothetical protein